ncbi:MAG: substrate-binding domain-containing protein [Reyranella sp.]|nr:substrate-binding domain-containing protein [Reyranella sp.]
MPLRTGLRATVLAAIGVMLALSPAWGETLRIGGTGAVTELLRRMGPALTADTGIALEVVPGLGTTGANSAVADGKLGLAFSGRELRDREMARGLRVAAVLRTPFGFVTSRQGPDNLKKSGIVALFRADRPMWPDGTPILIHLRPADESDYIVLGELFPGMTEVIQQLRKRRDLSVVATDQDNADMAEKVKGSLAAATFTQIVTEKRDLRFVSIDGVAPSLENYLDGSYPYGKSLYVIVPSAISPDAQAFLAFLAGPAGVALLRQAALIAGK